MLLLATWRSSPEVGGSGGESSRPVAATPTAAGGTVTPQEGAAGAGQEEWGALLRGLLHKHCPALWPHYARMVQAIRQDQGPAAGSS